VGDDNSSFLYLYKLDKGKFCFKDKKEVGKDGINRVVVSKKENKFYCLGS
jgi:hypothetical protein